MRCLFCQKKIGFIRRFIDREYCSDEHRRQMRTMSARAVRDALDYGDFDAVSPVFVKPIDELSSSKSQHSSAGSTAIFATLILVAVLVGSMGIDSSGGSSIPRDPANLGLITSVRKMIKEQAAVKLSDDFHGGLTSWSGATSQESASDWSFNHGFVRPGRLRLWKESMGMTDYQLEFVAQIEKKSLGWVYRAPDLNNYYATKITITKPGPLPVAGFVRYAVIDGKERERTSLPLPMTVRNDTLYRVQMAIKGDQYSTTVNGQMVDTWTDPRLPVGGVGFFSDKGEQATIRWVTVSNRDNFIGRVLSYLGFYVPLTPLLYQGHFVATF